MVVASAEGEVELEGCREALRTEAVPDNVGGAAVAAGVVRLEGSAVGEVLRLALAREVRVALDVAAALKVESE